jgi:murein DD-endopeptidase MepM/ murein hydrolase activator NlpD
LVFAIAVALAPGASCAQGGALRGLYVSLHTMRTGESVGTILKQYQTTRGTLESQNPNVNLDDLKPGDRIRILSRPGVFQKLQPGLTISDVAVAYQLKPQQLLDANEIMNPRKIQAGLELYIPDADPLTEDRRRRLQHQQRVNVIRAPRGAFGRPIEMAGRLIVSDRFGHRRNPLTGEPQMHAGLDFVAPYGTAILAARDGVVAFAGWKGGYGKVVILQHANGYETYYGHTTEYYVHQGERVVEGQLIARVGTTGDSTAPHLHFEIRIDGNPRNPERWMARYM